MILFHLALVRAWIMALKASNLQQIPKRNIDATFGYVKEYENKNNQIIPSIIKYLCLVYFNQTQDGFDDDNTNKNLKIDRNLMKLQMDDGSSYKNVNSYLQNIVFGGIHIWKFAHNCVSDADMIGIRNIDIGPLPLDGKFDEVATNDSVSGYAFSLGGICKGEEKYGSKCEDGDIIDMILNFENLSLRYKINDVDCCWYVNRNVNAFDIVKGRYKAVVSIYADGGACTIQLMSYQHIV